MAAQVATVRPFADGHGGAGRWAEGQLNGGQREFGLQERPAATAAKPTAGPKPIPSYARSATLLLRSLPKHDEFVESFALAARHWKARQGDLRGASPRLRTPSAAR